ncbi:hypothetical protein B481_2018 [Planococcus halocryophilus Or1]|nr:hypothetical protein B481_2018 [Planococcus halocryophilus Or1]
MLWFYRFENGQRIWQYGRYRPTGVNWMLRNGWRLFEWEDKK